MPAKISADIFHRETPREKQRMLTVYDMNLILLRGHFQNLNKYFTEHPTVETQEDVQACLEVVKTYEKWILDSEEGHMNIVKELIKFRRYKDSPAKRRPFVLSLVL